MSNSTLPLSQHFILLTGASRGIGAQVARKICDLGGRVWLVARNQDALSLLSDQLNQNTPGQAQWSSVDLSDLEQLKQWLKDHQEQLTFITTLIHNAGLDDFKPFEAHTLNSLEAQINLNFTAPLLINR